MNIRIETFKPIDLLWYIPLLLILFILLLINNLIVLAIGILLSFFLIFVYRWDLILSIIIILCLSIRGEEISSLRSYIIFLAWIILLLLFLKKFGINFRNYPKIPGPLFFLIVILILTIFISTTASGYQISSIDALLRAIVFLSMCYSFYAIINSEKMIFNYLFSLMISSLIISITIYIQLIEEGYTLFLSSGYLSRFTGSNSSNIVGLLFMVTSLLATGFLFIKREKKTKYLIYLFLANNFFILLIINSRLAFVGTILGFLITLYMLNRKLFLRIFTFSVIIFFIFLFTPSLKDFSSVYFRSGTLTNREDIWGQGIEMIKDYPLFGVGPRLYPSRAVTYYSSDYMKFQEWLDTQKTGIATPHNYLLLMAAENGILGIICVLLLVGIFIYYGFKAICITKNTNYNLYVLSLSLITIGALIFLRSIFEFDGIFNYGYINQDLPFWLAFVIIIYIYQKDKSQEVKPND